MSTTIEPAQTSTAKRAKPRFHKLTRRSDLGTGILCSRERRPAMKTYWLTDTTRTGSCNGRGSASDGNALPGEVTSDLALPCGAPVSSAGQLRHCRCRFDPRRNLHARPPDAFNRMHLTAEAGRDSSGGGPECCLLRLCLCAGHGGTVRKDRAQPTCAGDWRGSDVADR